MMHTTIAALIAVTTVLAGTATETVQDAAPPPAQDGAPQRAPEDGPRRPRRRDSALGTGMNEVLRREALERGIAFLLESQEGAERAEWPYEGVYRVAGSIPIGYRVGGTGICAMALAEAPGYAEDPQRQAAVRRAIEFVCAAADDPLMSVENYDGGYDVRGWGYCYALRMLLALRADERVPEELRETVDGRIRHYVAALEATEIPTIGGWNYSRPPGAASPGPSSPFMTAPCLRALYEARAAGFTVDAAVVERALVALEKTRTTSGAFAYAAALDGANRRDGTPGAMGRMLSGEITLYLAGRSDLPRVRGALDAFIAHWKELEARRARPGTHMGPYAVAPYYFFFAHLHAAEAIELLPAHERPSYRARLEELLFSVRDEAGTWNDRVFPRSASYGTAMTMLALLAPAMERPVGWTATQD